MSEVTHITRDRILETTTRVFGVSKEELKGDKRDRAFVMARASAASRMRSQTKKSVNGQMSFPRIGVALGSKDKPKDHTTVMHYIEQVGLGAKGDSKAIAGYADKKFRKLHKIAARHSRPKNLFREAVAGDMGFEPVLE